MLKNDVVWPTHRQYKSKTDWEPVGFFSECLCNSKCFDLMLGFFSSSAINILSDSFATFIYNGGLMRLIINNILSDKDKSAVVAGMTNEYLTAFDLTNLTELKTTLSAHDKQFFECLAWLISNKRIEIKVIVPKGTTGISHTKSGAFNDGINTLAFNGSCNFSKTALIENIESIDAFCDWDGEVIEAKVQNTISNFENTFLGVDETVKYINPEDIITNIAAQFGNKTLEELLENEKRINIEKLDTELRPSIRKVLYKAKVHIDLLSEKIQEYKYKPHFPYHEGPREYQKQAFDNWKNNGQKGLFAMATGTGKTITSLNCLLEEYKITGFYRAIILVPTIALVEQWEKECKKFNFNENIIKICSNNNWLLNLGNLEMLNLLGKEYSFILIATYASFNINKFQTEFRKLPKETLFIADEAHNMGSPSILRKLNTIHLQKRIGLSATPERQYQDEINEKIKMFFNEYSEKYTFEYSMYDAIKKEPKALCTYRYYPVIIKLTEYEFADYIELTRKITTFKPKTKEEKEIFNILCMKRQRILHKAENKVDAFKEILLSEFVKKGSLKYTLVYAPEGLGDEDTVFDASKNDTLIESESDRNILNYYTKLVSEINNKITVKQFTGNTSFVERINILKEFSNGTLEVITSMKCLDEGVDVPRSELAIFCASTGNPRQFIQRRGRVLRLDPLKHQATIYDLVVIPDRSDDKALFNIEKNVVEKELRRIRDFATMSENEYDTFETLKDTLNYYQLIL